ncbi:MAG: FG-GAP-like repeat-containing protein [Polyangiaceae bacterium]
MGSSLVRVVAVASAIAALLFGAACGSRTTLIDDLDVPNADSGAASDAFTNDAFTFPIDAGPPACGACTSGETECVVGGLSSCALDSNGCGEWGAAVPCDDTQTCAGPRGGASCRIVDVRAPRLMAPLSTSRVTTRRPRLRWTLAGQDDGARIEICSDRACTKVVTSFTAIGTSGSPSTLLGSGTYFWRARGMEGTFTSDDTSAVWQFTVPARDTPRNTSWGTTFDGNGDGFADVVVGAREMVVEDHGAAYVYAGGANGLTTTPTQLDNPNHNLSAFVASAGDVNGDGFADLAVGIPDADTDIGLVALYLGSPTGPTTPPMIFNAPKGHFEFGGWIESAGDMNGDGYGDVLVSDVDENDNATIFLYLGGPTGLSSSATTTLHGGPLVGITSCSDVNGDGFPDVVIGVNGPASSNQGEIDVYLGSAAGLATIPASVFLFHGPTAPDDFIVDVTDAGDVNGDGFGDVLVGTEGIGNGTVSLFLGSATGLVSSVTIPNPGTGGIFGDRLSGAGDVDQDGFDDVIVGAPGYPVQNVYVYFGNASGLSTTPIVLTSPAGNTGSFGDPVAGGGDVDGDGFDDVIVGGLAPQGSAWVYSGGKDRLAKPPLTLASPSDAFLFSQSVLE